MGVIGMQDHIISIAIKALLLAIFAPLVTGAKLPALTLIVAPAPTVVPPE